MGKIISRVGVKVTHEDHSLKLLVRLLDPKQILFIMEGYIKEGKLLHATRGRTIREIVDKANELNIQREDVVTILQENGYYVILYYYLGI